MVQKLKLNNLSRQTRLPDKRRLSLNFYIKNNRSDNANAMTLVGGKHLRKHDDADSTLDGRYRYRLQK